MARALDGQRAQRHVERGEAVACFSRRGLEISFDTRNGVAVTSRDERD